MAASVIDQAEQSVVRVINIDQQGNRLTISGVGSGVVIDRAGFILTNEHVIARADKVYVQWKTSGGEVRDDEAELVAQDPQKDLALLRVRRIDAPIVSIATGVLSKGQTVFAIGFPGAADLPGGTVEDINQRFVEATVTQGIVSRLLIRDFPKNPRWPLVQHSAATSGGSSGGALINGCGHLVGVNSAVAIEEIKGGDFVKVAGFSYAIQAPAVFRFAKNNGADPKEVQVGCETEPSSAQSVSADGATQSRLSPTIVAFLVGAIAVLGAAIAVIVRSRKRGVPPSQATKSTARMQWEIEGYTSTNEPVRFLVIADRHTEARPLIIGRDASCGAVITDATVSRTHAKLFVARGELWCADLASSNGTKVNERSCGTTAICVPRSGVLTLGKVSLRVRGSDLGSAT